MERAEPTLSLSMRASARRAAQRLVWLICIRLEIPWNGHSIKSNLAEGVHAEDSQEAPHAEDSGRRKVGGIFFLTQGAGRGVRGSIAQHYLTPEFQLVEETAQHLRSPDLLALNPTDDKPATLMRSHCRRGNSREPRVDHGPGVDGLVSNGTIPRPQRNPSIWRVSNLWQLSRAHACSGTRNASFQIGVAESIRRAFEHSQAKKQ